MSLANKWTTLQVTQRFGIEMTAYTHMILMVYPLLLIVHRKRRVAGLCKLVSLRTYA